MDESEREAANPPTNLDTTHTHSIHFHCIIGKTERERVWRACRIIKTKQQRNVKRNCVCVYMCEFGYRKYLFKQQVHLFQFLLLVFLLVHRYLSGEAGVLSSVHAWVCVNDCYNEVCYFVKSVALTTHVMSFRICL